MSSIKTNFHINLNRHDAFEIFIDEFTLALSNKGIDFNQSNHKITENENEIGKILSWIPGESFSIEWNPVFWKKSKNMKIKFQFAEDEKGTLISFEQENLVEIFNNQEKELLGWFASEFTANFFKIMTANPLIDWLTDRSARKPSGSLARNTYADPLFHWPNFLAIMDSLKITSDDYLLEIGCGGGAFLHEILKSGCKAAAIDHSIDMVKLAKKNNQNYIDEEKLKIYHSDATELPFTDNKFTCAVSTGVFQFIRDPSKVFKEIFRVLTKNGRLILYTGTKELQGTPAAPEYMASRIHYFEDNELAGLIKNAGFKSVLVNRPDLSNYAKKVGIPEEHIGIFSPRFGQLTIAMK